MNEPRWSATSRMGSRLRSEPVEPGARARVPRKRLTRAYLLALALPLLTALALTPFREDHGRTAAIILVVPVVLVATLGATAPALVAAFSAGLAYDVFLTEPYNSIAIDDPDEVAAMVALTAVGLIVGWLAGRVVQLGERATGRSNELRHLTEFSLVTTTVTDPGELIEQASRHVTAVLDLESCRWTPGPYQGPGPVLLPDGSLMGHLSDLNPDRAQLPSVCALPATAEDVQVGSFLLTSKPGTVASYEERRTAATVAQILASRLPRPDATPATVEG